MADFTEPTNPTFVGVRQIETNDPVLGGAPEIGGSVNSPPNYALRALVERTAKLKEDIEAIDIPAASRTVAGVARLATVAQVTAGTNDDRIVTPLLLQGKVDDIPSAGNASESTRGLIEVANTAEAAALTDDQRAMTPEKTLTGLRGSAAQASGSNRGTAAIASTGEADGGTNNTDIMTPSRVKRRIDAKIVQRTQAQYDALTPNSNILYVIVG